MIGGYNHKEIEKGMREHWKKIRLLSILQNKNSKGDPYFLLDGPPYANNSPHVGHIRNTIYKDMYIRLAFMRGNNVLFQPGFDTHGLPIENMVEKSLGFGSKKDIVKYGALKFCSKCKETAVKYKDEWLEAYDFLGSWYSWKEPYITYENKYIESVWWSFKQMWDKGLAYEGKKPVFWCPKCETALAGYEVSDKYADVTDPLIIVKFKVKGTENDYLLVFTTTPWTLPSNVAVVAKDDEDYVKVETSKGNLILAKNLVKLLDDLRTGYKILDEFKGKKLEGLEYESLLDTPTQQALQKNPKALKVYMSIPILKERISAKVAAKKGVKGGDVFEHFVSVSDGTGLVHCAPGHGKSDNLVGKHYGLPEVSPLDDQCKFTDAAGKYEGVFVKDSDPAIIEDLEKSGLMLYSHKIKHSYPLCWRCSAPLIFRMSNQWFLKVDPIKQKMLDANDKVNWQPDFAGERFNTWVANAEDWNFSRQRFWGTPIPVWKSEDGEYFVAGSIAELEKAYGKKLPDDFDLHTISEIKLKSKSGKEMSAVGDIFDVWYDSGSAPYAAFHYPFENKELFESHYPVDRINEAQDQIRGWFYSLMFCGVGALDKAPYKTISMPAWVLDKNGEKMSKSKGNYIAAGQTLLELGADNIRFYYTWDVDPAMTAKFDEAVVKTEVSRIHNILWNLHKLIITQAQASEDVKLSGNLEGVELRQEDRWIVSRLSGLVAAVNENYDNFKLHLAGKALYDFVINDWSRTYVQLVRDRLDEDDVPLQVSYYCLMTLVKLLAPVSPYISDAIYGNIRQELSGIVEDDLLVSVHLERFPATDSDEAEFFVGLRDLKLEESFEAAMQVVSAVLAARDSAQIGIRWPVKEVFIEADAAFEKKVKQLEDLVLRFVNAKSVEFKKVPKNFDVKINYKALGEEFGDKTADVATLIKKEEKHVAEKVAGNEESFKLGDFNLSKKFFNVKVLPGDGFAMGEMKSGCVFIKSALDESLAEEGYLREVGRRVQMLRKTMNLQKRDSIELSIEGDKFLLDIINQGTDALCAKVGAKKIFVGASLDKPYDELQDVVRNKKFVVRARKV